MTETEVIILVQPLAGLNATLLRHTAEGLVVLQISPTAGFEVTLSPASIVPAASVSCLMCRHTFWQPQGLVVVEHAVSHQPEADSAHTQRRETPADRSVDHS